jgi:hypothetical protein
MAVATRSAMSVVEDFLFAISGNLPSDFPEP